MKRKIGVFSLVTFLGLLAIVLFLGSSGWAQKAKPPKPPPADPAIAYSVFGPNRLDLMVMNADGSNQRVVVSEKFVDNTNPDWSPDGKQLVFTRYCLKGGCNGIYIVNVDGTDLRKVVDFNAGGGYIHSVAWSPVQLGDGKYKIAFTKSAQLPDGSLKADHDLFIVNLDGSGLVRLTNTPGVDEWEVDWSPSGDRIAVETYTPAAQVGDRGDVVVYRIDYSPYVFSATSLGSVINVPGFPLAAEGVKDVILSDWAKTQDKLVVSVGVAAATPSGIQYDLWIIYVLDPSSPAQLQLTFTPDQSEVFASWSPDDSKIVFLLAGNFWVMNSDGSEAKQIATPPGGRVFFKGPEWRRNQYQ